MDGGIWYALGISRVYAVRYGIKKKEWDNTAI